jgi:uncharacterized damage-inducible protein DinB
VIAHLNALHQHSEWADRRMLAVLIAAGAPVRGALRELAHVRGSQEVWLSRIERREATLPVWPEMSLDELAAAGQSVDLGWRRLLDGLSNAELARVVSYTNSAGQSFTTPLEEILEHVMLHAQYHRGKANVALRAAGLTPAGVDFIAWARGR